MGCGCGGGAGTAKSVTYVYTAPSGEQKTFKSEVEAVAQVQRQGGTYRPNN